MIQRALAQYSGGARNAADSAPDELMSFASDMLAQIYESLE
ncbi:hypothetical protein [Paenibacillus vortex]|nr:hypothetical protein [Paenibacillus vortex]